MLIGTAKQTNPAIGTPPIHRRLFAYFRERLARRPDSEHQAALIRIVIALIVSCYVVIIVPMDGIISEDERRVMALIWFIIPYSIGIMIGILMYPRVSVARRIVSIVVDLSATTYVLYFLGDAGTPVYGMYLFNACGNGFRFGERYLYLSSALGVAGFTFVLTMSDFWIAHRTLGIGLLIIMIVIPMYFASLVRQLRTALARMRAMATHDTLTGLPNRHSFYEQMQNVLKLAERNHATFAVVFVDLDGFKPINDNMGHAAGDTVLKSVSARLRESVRENDIVARFGGDEFVVVLSGIHRTAVPAVVSKLINTVAKPHDFNGSAITLTSSLGIAIYPDNGCSADELIAEADAAMYRSKHAGKNCYCLDRVLYTVEHHAVRMQEQNT